MHRLEVLVGPVIGEALRHVPLGVARRADHPEDEGGERDDREGKRALPEATLPFAQRSPLRPRPADGSPWLWPPPSGP